MISVVFNVSFCRVLFCGSAVLMPYCFDDAVLNILFCGVLFCGRPIFMIPVLNVLFCRVLFCGFAVLTKYCFDAYCFDECCFERAVCHVLLFHSARCGTSSRDLSTADNRRRANIAAELDQGCSSI